MFTKNQLSRWPQNATSLFDRRGWVWNRAQCKRQQNGIEAFIFCRNIFSRTRLELHIKGHGAYTRFSQSPRFLTGVNTDHTVDLPVIVVG